LRKVSLTTRGFIDGNSIYDLGIVLERPKSQIVIWQNLFIKTFDGLMSLWQILADERKLSAHRKLYNRFLT
jgi:hypothetical protein